MGLTDVIRGDDHLYNTPKQIVVYNALGLKLPRFYHVAMINNEQGKKLSKRDGATDVMEYKKLGFLPEALLNFLVRLGWSHGDQEIFSIEEMIELFDPNDINKSASSYSLDKLLWLNAHYIKNLPNVELSKRLEDYGVHIDGHDRMEMLLDITKERGKTLVDLAAQINLILEAPERYEPKAAKKAFKGEASELLRSFADMLKGWDGELHLPAEYHKVIEKFVELNDIGFGKIAQPLRVSLLGAMTGPGVDEVMAVIGVDETVRRLDNAVFFIEKSKD
jgi:glutamyl-tRNA synthetase